MKHLTEYTSFLGDSNENLNEKFASEADLSIGTTYKIYDKTDNNKLVYSFAEYVGKTKEGFKFKLTNRPKEFFIFLKDLKDSMIMSAKPFIKK